MFCRLFLGHMSVCGITRWCGEEEGHLAARGKLVDPRTDKHVKKKGGGGVDAEQESSVE